MSLAVSTSATAVAASTTSSTSTAAFSRRTLDVSSLTNDMGGGTTPRSCSASTTPRTSISAATTPRGSSVPLPELTAFIDFLRANGVKCVIFDMDRTLVAHHSGGCVPASQLDTFTGSLTSTSRRLIPLLLSEGFHIAVATFADDLYASYHKDQIAGVELVHAVMRELPCFSKAANTNDLEKISIVGLNPDLYSTEDFLVPVASAEEQKRMKSGKASKSSAIASAASSSASTAAASSSSAAAASSSAAPQSQLQQFFEKKLHAFGITPSHKSWSQLSVFPPLDYKNHHLLLIAAKLDLSMSELILLDDRDENVQAAIDAGAWGLFLEKKKGLILEDLREKNIQGPTNVERRKETRNAAEEQEATDAKL